MRRETNLLFSSLRIEVLYFGSEKSEKSQHCAPPVMKIQPQTGSWDDRDPKYSLLRMPRVELL